MKKILVPTDFSEHSEYALQTAAGLAKKHGASLVVLHMMGLSESILTRDESKEVFEAIYYMKLAKQRFSSFLDRDYLQGISVEETVQNYTDFNEISAVATEFNADLIVMGSHGASGIKEVFVGSNTEKVVRSSEIPVLVIKSQPMNFEMNRIVFACDFNPDFVKPFKDAWKFVQQIGAEFQVLYVNTPERFLTTPQMQEKALSFYLKTGIDNNDLFNNIVYFCDKNLESGIYNYSTAVKADMLVIPTHGRRGLAHFFSQNIGEAIVNHSSLPIKTFKV